MNQQGQEQTPYEKMKKWLDNRKMKEILARTLPSSVPIEPWILVALSTIRRDKKLLSCDSISLMGSLMTLAGMGLRLEGPLGQAYLEPFAVREKVDGNWVVVRVDAQLQVGYKGFIDLAYRIPGVVDLDVTTVRHNDHFKFQRGSTTFAEHSWDHRFTKEERGDIVLMYTALRYSHGYYSFSEPHMFEDVSNHRLTVLKDKNIRVEVDDAGYETYFKTAKGGREYVMSEWETGNNAWIKWPMAMMRKTVIRWDSKLWNLSPDFQRAAQLVAMDDAGVSQGLASVALEAVPPALLDEVTEGDLDRPKKAVLAPAQSISLKKSRNLAEQMAREAGAHTPNDDQPTQVDDQGGQGGKASSRSHQKAKASKRGPASRRGGRPAPKGNKKDQGGMTDAEKQGILDSEMREADEHYRDKK